MASALDNTVEAEMRRLARVDLLIIDDLALQAMDPVETDQRDARPLAKGAGCCGAQRGFSLSAEQP